MTAAMEPMARVLIDDIGPLLGSLFLLSNKAACVAAASWALRKASLRALACSKTGWKWFLMSVGVMAAWTLILWKVDFS